MPETKTNLRLRRNARARALRGHPWVYQSELESKLDDSWNGQSASLLDSRGRFMGSGIYNGQSQIAWRRFSLKQETLDAAYLAAALSQSIARRSDASCRRLVWSEADYLPGLVVDQFEGVLVVQALTLAMDHALPIILDWLQKHLEPSEIILRNDAPSRQYEGLEPSVRTLSGEPFVPREFTIDGIVYRLDLVDGQKTGFFLDQREQHKLVAGYAKGKRVLDGCCHLGGFALQAAKSGATDVLGIDSSAEAIAAARETAKRNALSADFEQANLFDWLRTQNEKNYGLIILDPPSFARNKRAVEGALRGYRELNLRALKMLEPGGILATYCCSAAVDEALFQGVVAEAASDAKRDCTILEKTGQPSDHPVLLTMPESQYLKGLIVRAK